MTLRVDAAIVGGGPAGAIVARRLAQRGWRVVLIERGPRLRPKTCGHCLAPRARPLLQNEGLLELVRDVAVGNTRALRVHAISGTCLHAPLAEDLAGAGWLVPRDRLDQALRDAAAGAGAMLLQPAAARVVQVRADGATLRVTAAGETIDVECRLLVGADGVGSAVARAAGLADARSAGRKYGFAMPVAGSVGADFIESGAIEMFLAAPLGGYIGVVRENDGRLHVAGLVSSGAGRPRRDPVSFLHAAGRIHPALKSVALDLARDSSVNRVTAVGPMPWRPHGVVRASVALVGDAAAYIEPFTGEGMAWAIESAALLTSTIAWRGDAWDARAADMYARMWQARIEQRQRLCRWVSGALERRLVSRCMLWAGLAAPRLTRRLVRQAVAA